jgi:hypothetical protein
MMKSRISLSSRLAFSALACAIASGPAWEAGAQDTTLADLVAGGMLMSSSGELLFSDFTETRAGDVDPNLENYVVESLEDGFRVVPAPGGLSAAAGEAGALVLGYQVTAAAGIQIVEMLLSFDASATGTGALARATQDYFTDSSETDMLGDAIVLVTGGGGSMTSAGFELAQPIDELHVLASLQVNVPQLGDASITFVDQEFITVPEPAATLLGLVAMLAVGALRRSRR